MVTVLESNELILCSKILDVSKKAGYLRSVDWVEFIMFALPIIVIEALQLQMKEVIEKEAKSRTPTMNQAGLVALAKSVEQSCSELSSFSRLCRLLQKFSLSKSDIAEIDRYV